MFYFHTIIAKTVEKISKFCLASHFPSLPLNLILSFLTVNLCALFFVGNPTLKRGLRETRFWNFYLLKFSIIAKRCKLERFFSSKKASEFSASSEQVPSTCNRTFEKSYLSINTNHIKIKKKIIFLKFIYPTKRVSMAENSVDFFLVVNSSARKSTWSTISFVA